MLYTLFYVCTAICQPDIRGNEAPHHNHHVCTALSLSLSCSRSIFSSHSHCIIIHWQVEPSTTNLLLSCFSLNIRSKYRVTKFNRGVASDLLCRLTFLICRFVELDDISRSFHWFHSVGVQNCICCTRTDKKCVHVCICVNQICYKWLWFMNCKSSRRSLQKL